MKPRRRSDLDIWMSANRFSDPKFAEVVTKQMPAGKRPISASAVAKWRLGGTMPRKDALKAIGIVTDGEVTAESFVHAEGP